MDKEQNMEMYMNNGKIYLSITDIYDFLDEAAAKEKTTADEKQTLLKIKAVFQQFEKMGRDVLTDVNPQHN